MKQNYEINLTQDQEFYLELLTGFIIKMNELGFSPSYIGQKCAFLSLVIYKQTKDE